MKYQFDAVTEKRLVWASLDERFYQAVTRFVDPAAMPTEAAGILVQSMRSDPHPGDIHNALQIVRNRLAAGSIAEDQMDDCDDYAEECMLLDKFSDRELADAVIPQIKTYATMNAVDRAASQLGKDGASDRLHHDMEQISEIGDFQHVRVFSSITDMSIWEDTHVDKLDFGITALDIAIGDGLHEGSLATVLGAEGDGKTTFLTSLAAHAWHQGIPTMYVTMEQSTKKILQRIQCNALNMTENDIKNNFKEAARRTSFLDDVIHVTHADPDTYKVFEAEKNLQQLNLTLPPNDQIQLLLVDYADLMMPGKRGNRESSYRAMKEVYEGLRAIAMRGDVKWVVTVSQVKSADRKHRKELTSASDSRWKTRTPDMVLSIEHTEEEIDECMVRFRVLKWREGRQNVTTPQIQQDFEKWQMAANSEMSRNYPW